MAAQALVTGDNQKKKIFTITKRSKQLAIILFFYRNRPGWFLFREHCRLWARSPRLPGEDYPHDKLRPKDQYRRHLLRRVDLATAHLGKYLTDGELRRHIHRIADAYKKTELHVRRRGGRPRTRRQRIARRNHQR